MQTTPNPVGDLMDDAVSLLTALARATADGPDGESVSLDFDHRIASILTHVAANVHGVHELLPSQDEVADHLRQIVWETSQTEDLHHWRTEPIVASPSRPSAVGASVEAYLAAMNRRADELGYIVPVVLADSSGDVDPADSELLADLEAAATTTTLWPERSLD